MMSATRNRLAILAADIRAACAEIRLSAEAMAERVIGAGHALIEVKRSVPHGLWAAWLSEHTELSARTANRYMQLAGSGVKSATVAELGLRAATEAVARRRAPSFPLPKEGECLFVRSVFVQDGQEIELGRALFWPSGRYLSYFDFHIFDAQYPGGGQAGGGQVIWGERPVVAEGIPIILGMHNLGRAPNHPTNDLLITIDDMDIDGLIALAAIARGEFEAAIENHKQAGRPITAASIIALCGDKSAGGAR